MLHVDHIETYGWAAAVRGMRNPMNSWDKSDSSPEFLGPNDLSLMLRLIEAGTDHSKFMRMLGITLDITAPLYWWKEFDTYKVGTVANSCSTMHKIHAKPFTLDDFSHEHLTEDSLQVLQQTILHLNRERELYLEHHDKAYWWQLIQLLPSSYNQKRTVSLNYAVARNLYFARKAHKLDEWHTLCNALVDELPYSEFISMKFS